MARLPCGCGPKTSCDNAIVLWGQQNWGGLHRHFMAQYSAVCRAREKTRRIAREARIAAAVAETKAGNAARAKNGRAA